jgi:hypothetical protein
MRKPTAPGWRSWTAHLRDLLNFDVSVTRHSLRLLGPEIQNLLCAPALALIALIDRLAPGA